MHKKVIYCRTSPVLGKYAVTVQFFELKYAISFAAESFTAANWFNSKTPLLPSSSNLG